MFRMKKSVSMLLALLLALGFAGVASAHVTVQPGMVAAGSYQVFTLRVPTEKEAYTTQIKVIVPAGVNITGFEPKPGWTYETEKDADGNIASFTWKADGQGLGENEFGQFQFQGKVADDATSLSWKAYQTYSDGSVVEWTGAPDADTPASVTTVTAAAGADSGSAAGASDRDPLTLTLAIVGAAAGVLALVVSLLRRRKA